MVLITCWSAEAEQVSTSAEYWATDLLTGDFVELPETVLFG